MIDLRLRVAHAIGRKLLEKAEGGKCQVPVWSAVPPSEQGILLDIADAALAAIASVDGESSTISDGDLRHILDMHRDAVDIVWGVGGYVAGLHFVEDVSVSGPNGDEDPRDYRADETYWRIAGAGESVIAA